MKEYAALKNFADWLTDWTHSTVVQLAGRPALNTIEKNRISRVILDTPGVRGFHHLRAHADGDVMVMKFHLEVDKDLPSYLASSISDAVQASLLDKYGPCDPTIRVEGR